MPTYQYACTGCSHEFETVQSFSDTTLTDCPVCAGTLRKVYGSVGVVFKGSGFYRNDSRANRSSGNGKTADKPAKEPVAAASSTESGKTAGKSGTPATTNGSAASASASPGTSSAGAG